MEDTNVRMAATFLLILSMFVLNVDSALFTHKNKYLNMGIPKKVQLGSDRQSQHRVRRATPGKAAPGEMLFTDVVLNGTEDHSQAFVHWSGKDKSEAVFILTQKVNATGFVVDSQTWRSLDYGKTYHMVNFTKDALISFFYVSPADHRKMVFTDVKNKRIYTSLDELQTNQNDSLPVASDQIFMHPTVPDWMLLYDDSQHQLYVTMDFGVSWSLLQSDVNSPEHVHWGKVGYDDNRTVHLEVQPQDSENAFYKKCTIPCCNGSDDTVDPNLGPFLPQTMLVINEYIFVQKTDFDGSNSHVMVSHNRTRFQHAFFPGNVKTKDFLLVSADDGQVFMAVNHGDNSGVSLYLSDPTGRYYTLCLENVHHRATRVWFEVDLHEVEGLSGTYLVNQLDGIQSDGRRLKTLISVDKGGSWKPLETTSCPDSQKTCNLILRLDLDSFVKDWILSETNAPGIVIAHGHYGETYEYDLKSMQVFTSSDGARTWKKAPFTGLYHFNILDQGGILTAIQSGDQGQTNTVYYSSNDGISWSNKSFGNNPLKVDGVLNEPGINTLVVSVYGHVNSNAPWTMVELNFSQVLSKCTDAQYEDWIPADHDQNFDEVCILGQRIQYKRRKPGEVCFNGEDFDRKILNSTCNCTAEDFECDFGYSWNKDETNCVKESWYNDSYVAIECEAGRPFQQSQGYRKVAADSCKGGLESRDPYKLKNITCPLMAPSQLILVSNVTVVATGDLVLFHVSQKLGSKESTNYTWDFNDTHTTSIIGHHNASQQIHTFSKPGLYNISVRAANNNGSSVSNTLELRVEDALHRIGVFTGLAAKVGFLVKVSAMTNILHPNSFGSLHYVWRFGDEPEKAKGLLTWEPNTNHTYTKAGTYTLTVTAVNAVSAFSKQIDIKVYDDAVVVRLNFTPNLDQLFYHMAFSPAALMAFLDSIVQELSMRTGVNMDRLCVTLNSTIPVRTDVLVTPAQNKDEPSAQQIVDTLTGMVKNKTLYLYESVSYRLGDVQVTGIEVVHNDAGGGGGSSDDKKKDGPNYRAVYISIPIVVLAAVITGLVLIYYRKRFQNMRRYSLVNQHEDTDALLDDDDEPPLDLRSDNRDESRSRDDTMLDLGTGSHLVMVTGNGGGDNAENC